MNLLELRTELVKSTGRYDLVENNAIDNYIRGGQKLLERLSHTTGMLGSYYTDLPEGQYIIALETCLEVHKVWIITPEHKVQLQRLPEYTIETALSKLNPYSNSTRMPPIGNLPLEVPINYYIRNLRRTGSPLLPTSPMLETYLDTQTEDGSLLNGIVLFPPPRAGLALEVSGFFKYPTLQEDTDSNYWSENFPELLLMSAARQLAVFYRGARTIKDWDDLIETELTILFKEDLGQQIDNITEMEG